MSPRGASETADVRASPLSVQKCVIAVAVCASCLLLVAGYNTTRWIGRTFPGFLLMDNRVVPSIALPGWAEGQVSRFFQHEVVAVNGIPLPTAAAIYEYVGKLPPGTQVAYEFVAPDLGRFVAALPSRRFSPVDYLLLFGAYLLNGVAFLSIGLVVFLFRPRSSASRALLASGIITGLFIITATDLYGPHWFFRLHVVCEAFLAAGFLHLALVFPTERLPRYRRRVIVSAYLASAVMAAVYELVLFSPRAYATIHLLATATHGVAAILVVAAVGYDLLESPFALVRRRTGVVALGTLSAFLIPAATMSTSAVLGGSIPINAGALTGFLFPLSLGYAVLKQDLFELDAMVRRATTYVVVLVALMVLYLTVLALLGAAGSGLAASPATAAVVNFALILLLAPMRERTQDVVDRLFFRRAYDAEQGLAELTEALTSTRTVQSVVAAASRVLSTTANPLSSAVFLWSPDGSATRAGDADSMPAAITLSPSIRMRAERGEILTRYEWEDGSAGESPTVWRSTDATIIVPICSGQSSLGFLTLGGKASGEFYNLHDAVFLRAVAGQLGLALANAQAFTRMEELNAKVVERTLELERANVDLAMSLETVQQAAAERERLVGMRARFVTQASHEFRTPLTAILAATEALRRYSERMTPEQQRQRLEKIASHVHQMTELIEEVLMLGRADSGGLRCQPQATDLNDLCRQAVAEVEATASRAHRLVLTTVDGSPSARVDTKLVRQILRNLLTNAIKYSPAGGAVELAALHRDGAVVLRVRDEGIGIPPEDQEHLFDMFHRGTNIGNIHGFGLGLAITQRAVALHNGTITFESTPGEGTTFVVTLTDAAPADAPGPDDGYNATFPSTSKRDGPRRLGSVPVGAVQEGRCGPGDSMRIAASPAEGPVDSGFSDQGAARPRSPVIGVCL